MYLKRLEIFGFKSFGHRVNFNFPPGVACVIGPNGVGKSNLVEAIRWAMGEQSLKTLRSKKSDDVIFSGSQIKLNLAEVFLHLYNEDKDSEIEHGELRVGRKVFKNSENEYFVNQNKVKLQDLSLTVAKANFGPRSYSVIGQGMVDAILYSSPAERKEFFAEATGLRQYQIKKRNAILKLKKTQENLNQAEIALKEVEPRMRFLTRQIKKLAQCQEIEKGVVELQRKYYGSKKFKLEKEEREIKKKVETLKKEIEGKSKQLTLQCEKIKKTPQQKGSFKFSQLQNEYQVFLEKRKELLEKISTLKAEVLLKTEEKEKLWEKEKVLKLKSDLKEIVLEIEKIAVRLEKVEKIEEVEEIRRDLLVTAKKMKETLGLDVSQEERLPSSEKLKELKEQLEVVNQKIKNIENNIQNLLEEGEREKEELIRQQEENQKKQEKISLLNFSLKEKEIELAKLETKKEDLEEEIKRESVNPDILSSLENKLLEYAEEEDLFFKIKRLKHSLEAIEATDPNISQEYEECRQRYEFLSSQTTDLSKAIESLKTIKKTLDEKIKKEFVKNFNKINQEFERYFKIIFKGGSAKLKLEEKAETEEESEENMESSEEEERWLIEIQARPPGKKIKTVETLSGGEKALTSLALVFAIIKTKSPPFVVLDEVDATLDEINSLRFTEIIRDLAKKIQFIIITHNQTTMEVADLVYGLTMKTDGASHPVSLKLERG